MPPQVRVSVTGVGVIRANLKIRGAAMAAGYLRGARLAGLLLQRESQELVSVEYGPLKASAYTRSIGLDVFVGYTAAYAIYVHEAVGMVLRGQPRPSGLGNYWDPAPQARAKFLEEPARRLRPAMLAIIHQNMRIS